MLIVLTITVILPLIVSTTTITITITIASLRGTNPVWHVAHGLGARAQGLIGLGRSAVPEGPIPLGVGCILILPCFRPLAVPGTALWVAFACTLGLAG